MPVWPRRAVVSTVPSDSHMWNLVFLELLLREGGVDVTNLGACTPTELVVETCLTVRPDLLVVSSVNGHGYAEGHRLIAAIREEPELESLPAVIGGMLGVLVIEDAASAASLVEAGYSAVFADSDRVPALRRYLQIQERERALVVP